MRDASARLIWALPAAALAIASALWLAASAAAPGPSALAEMDVRLTQSTPQPRRAIASESSTAGYVTALLARPVLQISAGEGGADPTPRLEGIALTPSRSAALLAIGSAPAAWLQLGESRAGVTLKRVEPQSVVVESLSGEHSLTLGHQALSPALTTASQVEAATAAQIRTSSP